jgi:hypothetical protein
MSINAKVRVRAFIHQHAQLFAVADFLGELIACGYNRAA